MNALVAPQHLPNRPRIAILLNGNARRVKPELVERFARYLPREDIYYSQTLRDARMFCEMIYHKGYDLVFTGGGDGTLLRCLTELRACQQRAQQPRRLPVLGVLHLGTGNGVASFLGAHPQVTPNLHQARQNSGFRIREQRWVQVNGQLAPFSGLGVDGLMLNHYKAVKNKLEGTPLSFLGAGVTGYMTAMMTKTVPYLMMKKLPEIEVITEGPAFLIDAEGDYVREYRAGDLLYKGPMLVSSVSTVPFYGYNVKVFPHAYSGQHMQLRIGAMPVLEALRNIVGVWRGTYRSPKLLDFHVRRVRVKCSEPAPLQIGGDPAGHHDEVVYELSSESTYLADFRQPKQLPSLTRPSHQLMV